MKKIHHTHSDRDTIICEIPPGLHPLYYQPHGSKNRYWLGQMPFFGSVPSLPPSPFFPPSVWKERHDDQRPLCIQNHPRDPPPGPALLQPSVFHGGDPAARSALLDDLVRQVREQIPEQTVVRLTAATYGEDWFQAQEDGVMHVELDCGGGD